MAEIIDIRSKKKVDPSLIPEATENYKDRIKGCLEYEMLTAKPCPCEVCSEKRQIAAKLVTISNYMCLDHMEKNKDLKLFWGDWLDIMTDAYSRVAVITSVDPGKK
jgi:hypothetical protein